MKAIIVYGGKSGTTEKCAKILSEKIGNAPTINLHEKNTNVSDYDLVIIGSNIRAGMMDGKVRKFIIKNREVLDNKKLAFYICCGFAKNKDQYFTNNFPKELLDKSIVYDTFGGEMDISKQKGFDKFVIKAVSKSNNVEVKILEENIEEFVEKIKEVE